MKKCFVSVLLGKPVLKDFGNPYFRVGLRTLLKSVNEDVDLHLRGRFFLHWIIVTFLSNRLLLTEQLNQQPFERYEQTISPIIVFGLHRSGTTYLHQLLASLQSNRAIPQWQLMRPIQDGKWEFRRLLARLENLVKCVQVPSLDRIHFSRFDTFEECIIMMGTTFSSSIFLFPGSGI